VNIVKSVVGYTVVLLLVLLLVLLFAPSAQGQDKREVITVKNAQTGNDVVTIIAQSARTSIELQCNKGFDGCTVLEPGDYVMVRLPQNHGMYECANVEVFAKASESESNAQKLGSYCINEK